MAYLPISGVRQFSITREDYFPSCWLRNQNNKLFEWFILQRVALNDFNTYLSFSSKASYSHSLKHGTECNTLCCKFPHTFFFFTFVRERILQCYKNSTRITSDPNCSFLQAIQERPSLVFDISQELSFTVQKVS